MNKCYSKVWNAALGQVVVASELASTKSNGSTVGAGRANQLISRAGLAVALGFALAGTLPSVAFAADAVCVDPTNTTTPVPVGNATAAGDQVACGTGAVASAANTVAIGNVNVKASATNAVAVGSQNVTASGAQSVALGYNANATNTGAIAIGAGNGPTGITSTSALGANSIAIGSVAYANGDNAVAIGRYATTAANSVGIGYEADTAGERTVSVGYNTYAGNEAVNIGYANTGFAGGFRGAFRRGSTLVGYLAESGGAYTTVMGNNSNILTNQNVKVGGFGGSAMFSPQGAFSNVFGAYNKVGTLTDLPTHTSIAVSVVGAANNVNDSNGVFIGGYGNTIKNAYDDKLVINDLLGGSTFDTSAAIASRIQDPNTALGQVGIIGAGNTIDTAKNTFVSGVKNKVSNANLTQVTGFQQVADKIDNVFIAGSTNTVNSTSKSFIAGTGNTVNNASGILAMGSNQKIGTAAGNTAKNSILLGDNINYAQTTSQQDSVAVGNDTEAATGAVAVGVTAKAKGDYSIAIGYDAIATGSVATGLSARAGNGGAAYGDGAIATYLGGATTAGTVAGTAVGQKAIADISGATAIGAAATANLADSVAIGSSSVASIAAGIAGYDLATGTASTLTNSTWVSTRAAVSVGDVANGITRQITSVAAGAADTDAVNVAQLKQAVAGSATHFYSVNNTDDTAGNYNNDGAAGVNSLAAGVSASTTAAAVNGVAIGYQSLVGEADSIAIGTEAQALSFNQVSIGNFAGNGATDAHDSTFVGAQAGQSSAGSYNTGVGSSAFESSTGLYNSAFGIYAGAGSTGDFNTSIGDSSGRWVQGNTNTALGYGTGTQIMGNNNLAMGYLSGSMLQGSANSAQGFFAGVGVTGDNNVAIGTTAGTSVTVDATGGLDLASLAPSTYSNAVNIGNQTRALIDDAVAIGNGATAQASKGDVALGAGSVTAAPNATPNGVIGGVEYAYAGGAPTSVVSVGDVGAERQITNVAAGRVTAASTDAINGSQLYATNAAIDKGINFGDGSTSNKYNLGDTINVRGDAGGNITSTTTTDGVVLGLGNVVTIGAANPVVINGNTGTVGGLTNKTWDPNNFVSGQAATEDQLSQIATTAVQAKSTVTAGTNMVVTASKNADGSDNYEVATAKDVTFDTVQVGGVKIDGATNIISGVAAGELSSTSTEAVNGSQLYQTNNIVNNLGSTTAAGLGGGSTYDPATGTVTTSLTVNGTKYDNVNDALQNVNSVANAGWNLTANKGANGTNVAPGGTVDLYNNDGNIVVTKTDADNNVAFDLAKDIKVDSVTAGNTKLDTSGMTTTDGTNTATFGPTGMTLSNGTVINNTTINVAAGTTINMGNNVISGVAPGVAGTDAVNVDQLKAIAANAGNTSVTAGNNMVVTESLLADGTKNYEVATSKNVAFDSVKVGNVNIDGTTGKITGVTAGTISATSTDAVNGSQLYATNQKIDQVSQVANAGWNISAQGQNKSNVAPGALVDMKNTDGNIVITKSTASNDINFNLGDDIRVKSVILGNGTTTVNQNGLIITNGPSVTTGGINAGGMAITNVKAGSAPTDAVNVSQLNAMGSTTLNQANAYTDSQINLVKQDIWEVRKGYRGGTATALATGNLPQAFIPGKNFAAIGFSTFQGETGMAIGVSGISDNARYIYKLSGSTSTNGEWGAAISAGMHW